MDLLVQIAQEIDFRQCCLTFVQDLKKFNLRKPCCGYTLSNGVVAIAILDVIGAVLGVLPLVIMLIAKTVFKDFTRSIKEDLSLLPMESAKTVEKSFTMFLSILTMVISVSLLEFYFTMLLLNATEKKKITSCYKWWRLVVVVLIAILFGISAIIIESYRVPLIVVGIIFCLYKLYCFWIVLLFESRIGTVEKDSDITLPTVCSDADNFHHI